MGSGREEKVKSGDRDGDANGERERETEKEEEGAIPVNIPPTLHSSKYLMITSCRSGMI